MVDVKLRVAFLFVFSILLFVSFWFCFIYRHSSVEYNCNMNTIMILCFWQTNLCKQCRPRSVCSRRCILMEQSDQGLHCFTLSALFEHITLWKKLHRSILRIITAILSGVQIFRFFRYLLFLVLWRTTPPVHHTPSPQHHWAMRQVLARSLECLWLPRQPQGHCAAKGWIDSANEAADFLWTLIWKRVHTCKAWLISRTF